jgi:DnaK suppressor protein
MPQATAPRFQEDGEMATMAHRVRGAGRARHATLERLLRQHRELLQERRQVLRDSLPVAATGVLDCEEQALDAEEQGIGFSVLELTSRTVHGIETALRRLAAGQLGTCSDCRCRISDARLRALPFAALCLACQERHDLAAGWRGRAASARTGALGQ